MKQAISKIIHNYLVKNKDSRRGLSMDIIDNCEHLYGIKDICIDKRIEDNF